MYYKDDFNVTFKEESAFYRYLDDVEKRAEWFRAQSKDLKVEAVTKNSICSPIGNIDLEYLKDDTLKNSGLADKDYGPQLLSWDIRSQKLKRQSQN